MGSEYLPTVTIETLISHLAKQDSIIWKILLFGWIYLKTSRIANWSIPTNTLICRLATLS